MAAGSAALLAPPGLRQWRARRGAPGGGTAQHTEGRQAGPRAGALRLPAEQAAAGPPRGGSWAANAARVAARPGQAPSTQRRPRHPAPPGLNVRPRPGPAGGAPAPSCAASAARHPCDWAMAAGERGCLAHHSPFPTRAGSRPRPAPPQGESRA